MAKYAVVNSQGEVVNYIEWDGESPYRPAPGLSLLHLADSDEAVIPRRWWLHRIDNKVKAPALVALTGTLASVPLHLPAEIMVPATGIVALIVGYIVPNTWTRRYGSKYYRQRTIPIEEVIAGLTGDEGT